MRKRRRVAIFPPSKIPSLVVVVVTLILLLLLFLPAMFMATMVPEVRDSAAEIRDNQTASLEPTYRSDPPPSPELDANQPPRAGPTVAPIV
jgi:hypothetical protein